MYNVWSTKTAAKIIPASGLSLLRPITSSRELSSRESPLRSQEQRTREVIRTTYSTRPLFMLLEDLKAIGWHLEPRHFICISISRRRASTYTRGRDQKPQRSPTWLFSLCLSYSNLSTSSSFQLFWKKEKNTSKTYWNTKSIAKLKSLLIKKKKKKKMEKLCRFDWLLIQNDWVKLNRSNNFYRTRRKERSFLSNCKSLILGLASANIEADVVECVRSWKMSRIPGIYAR